MTRAWQRSCIDIVLAGALGLLLAMTASIVSVRAQASLSEKLTRQISSAQKAETERQYDSAIKIYGQALGHGLDGVEGRRELLKRRATLYEQLSEFDKAEDDFTAVLRIEPVDPNAYAERGYFYFRRNRYADALADFVAGWRMQPNTAMFRFAAGRVEAALGNFHKAIDCYTDAARLDPTDGRPILARAEAYVHLGQYGVAKQDYTRSVKVGLRRYSDKFYAYLGRGYASLKLDEYDAAVGDFDQALTIDPDAVNALALRGYANEKRGRNDLALNDYESASRHGPNDLWVVAGLKRLRSN
jgi:tetratricopeptide (TPR) repeat protein